MNEQQTPDEQPRDPAIDADAPAIRADDPSPRQPATRDADATGPEPEGASERASTRRGRGILRPILIGSGAAAVVLAVAGVGLSIADAADDDDDDRAPATASESASASADGDDDLAAVMDGSVPAEPADLAAAIDAAVEAAGGGEATSVEVERDGWKVDVRLADGSEVEVRVPVAGDPVVRADDDDDRSSDAPLEAERVGAIGDAAIAAAGGGVVLSIETEDDADVRFEVEVGVDGESVDIELAEDLSVLSVER
jgi:hypothetical protein